MISSAKTALDRDRTGDLFLTKEVLCQLSYKGGKTVTRPSNTSSLFLVWSGKRDLNPRPPAWKAGALPLSYSRFTRQTPPPHLLSLEGRVASIATQWNWGGEDSNLRSLTATDLQSVPFVRSGTSPGATGGNRTPDRLITNQLLYQLSYGGLTKNENVIGY